MRTTLLLAAALLLFGCKKSQNDSDTGTGHDTSTDTSSNDTGNTSDTSDTSNSTDTTDTAFHNGWTGADDGTAPSRAPDEVIYGDLADGGVYSDLTWAQDLNCWPANQDEDHDGAHDFHERDQPEATDLWVRITPNQGLDMAAYLVQRPSGSTALPPSVTLGASGDCTNTYPATPNPSQPEVVCVAAFTGHQYSVLIGATGSGGLDHGLYKLEIWQNSYTGCVHPDP